jgi:hypothetical protein
MKDGKNAETKTRETKKKGDLYVTNAPSLAICRGMWPLNVWKAEKGSNCRFVGEEQRSGVAVESQAARSKRVSHRISSRAYMDSQSL